MANKLRTLMARFGDWIGSDPMRAAVAFLAGAVVILALLLVGTCSARAADAQLSWTHPTSYVPPGNEPLPLSSILSTDLEYGLCNATRLAFAGTTTTVSVPAPATTRTVTGLAAGAWCFRVRTVVAGASSAWAGPVSKDVVLIPNPPVLAVPVIAGMLQTPVYSVAATGKMSTFVGFTDVGSTCSGPVLFTYRSQAFREVPRSSVKLWGSTSLRLAAPCA